MKMKSSQQKKQQQHLQSHHHHKHENNPKNSSNRCYISLACSIGSISIACGSLLQLNSTSDRISLQRGLFLTSMGFVYFISLTDFFNKYFLETSQGIRFRRKYHLMISDVMDITNKLVSAIQAAFSCLAGFIVCKSSCNKSFLYASHFVMEAYAWFGTAYFMYDIWSMYIVHTQKIADKLKLMNITTKSLSTSHDDGCHNRNDLNNENYPKTTTLSNGELYDKHKCSNDNSNDGVFTNSNDITDNAIQSNIKSTEIIPNNSKYHSKQHENEFDYGEIVEIPKDGRWDFLKYIITHPVMIIHHVFIGTFGLLVVTYLRGGFGDCVYSFIYLMEFSTPFVSLRSILSTLGLKNTHLYIVNGLIMLGTFFLCRIVMWPYVLHGYSIAINRPFVQAIMGLPRGCKISILILFIPQLYWFSLMFKGAIKVFCTPNRSNQQTDDNNKLNNQQQTQNQSSQNNRPINFNDYNNLSQKLQSSLTVQNQNSGMEKSPNQSRTLF